MEDKDRDNIIPENQESMPQQQGLDNTQEGIKVDRLDEVYEERTQQNQSIDLDKEPETHYDHYEEAYHSTAYYEMDPDYMEESMEYVKPSKGKGSMTRFIIGLLVVSLVGGGAVGTGIGLVLPYATAHYNDRYPNSNVSGGLISYEDQVGRVYSEMVQAIETDPSIKTIAKQVGPSVVSIYNNKKISPDSYYAYFYDSSEEMITGFGSGIIFNEDAEKYYIVTNSHVVEGADSLAVNFLGDIKAEAKLVGEDSLNDIAVIYVEKKKLSEEERSGIKIAVLGDSDLVEVGELAVAIGTPMEAALNNTVTAGIISGLEREVILSDKRMSLIQTNAAINPGNSGGALVGATGEVIGINVAKASTGEGIGFAIPINTVKPIINDLIENGSVIRPGLGITGKAISDLDSDLYELPIGIYVISILTGGSADLAGMQEGDIIIQFEGNRSEERCVGKE